MIATHKILEECPPDSKLSCTIPCDKLCMYYQYILKQKSICVSEHDCAGYECAPNNTTLGCHAGQYFANQNTCVNIQDCMCVDYNGNPVKVTTNGLTKIIFNFMYLSLEK